MSLDKPRPFILCPYCGEAMRYEKTYQTWRDSSGIVTIDRYRCINKKCKKLRAISRHEGI